MVPALTQNLMSQVGQNFLNILMEDVIKNKYVRAVFSPFVCTFVQSIMGGDLSKVFTGLLGKKPSGQSSSKDQNALSQDILQKLISSANVFDRRCHPKQITQEIY